jgi:hypothetical protein
LLGERGDPRRGAGFAAAEGEPRSDRLAVGQSTSVAGKYLLSAGISIDVRMVGMRAGEQDNTPYVQALMATLGRPANAAGYDVTFPDVPGQTTTVYYFYQPLVLSQGANYHCSGTTFQSATYLVFAPGVDGVVQDQSGGGMVSGCSIVSTGQGAATANAVSDPNVLTGVSMPGDLTDTSPSSLAYWRWHYSDGQI